MIRSRALRFRVRVDELDMATLALRFAEEKKKSSWCITGKREQVLFASTVSAILLSESKF